MEVALKPLSERPPGNWRTEVANAGDGNGGFATAVEATLEDNGGTVAQMEAPVVAGKGGARLSPPPMATDNSVVATTDEAPLPVVTSQLAATAVTSMPKGRVLGSGVPTATVDANPATTAQEPVESSDRDEEHLAKTLTGSSEAAPKGTEAKEPVEDGKPPPQAAALAVLVRATIQSVPARSTHASPPKAGASESERDETPVAAADTAATLAPLPLPSLSVPKLHDAVPDANGAPEIDVDMRKGSTASATAHAVRASEPHGGERSSTGVEPDSSGFALPPSMAEKGDPRAAAPALAGTETVRAPAHAAEQKSPTASPPAVAAQPGRIGHELGVEIARRLTSGGDQLVVRLVPAELGRIEVRMSFDDRGAVNTVFAADSPVALDMLRRDSADLSRALNDAGFRSEANTMRFDTGERGGGSQPRTPWQNAAQKAGSSAEAEPEVFAQTTFRTVQTRGRYNLMA